MNDTERLKCETEMLPKLKRHLNSVMCLRPIEELSPLSVSILKNAKGFTDEIGAWAGSLTRWEGADERFKELLASMKLNCTAEEVEVIETALESFEWVYDDLKCYPFSVCKSLNGDEVFWAWDFLMMSDEQIKHGDDSDGEKRLGRRWIVLKRFADLGIDVFEGGEKREEKTEGLEPTLKETELAEGFVNEFIRSHFGFKETALAEVSDKVLSLYVSEKFTNIVREHPNMVTELAETMNYDLVCIQSGDGESELKQPTCARGKRGEARK